MVSLIDKGPDIPERLLHAQEEGNVVFFCGAGISAKAGLPLFKELVSKIYKTLNEPEIPTIENLLENGLCDRAIDLMIRQSIRGRNGICEIIQTCFQPDFIDIDKASAISTHKSLLTLAQRRNKTIKLVTTNCDRLFEEAISANTNGDNAKRYIAPLLPIPKNRWDGLIYLHGLLPENAISEESDNIVISSGDFGLAYLIERWASRFVSELFNNYTICFVGYSIEDPIFRYLMDAIAAERSLGENTLEHFAFVGYETGKMDEKKNEWEAQNVIPILYDNVDDHNYLHKTLDKWADIHCDGINGKKMIIRQYAQSSPLSDNISEEHIIRVLWALQDQSAAQLFSEIDPVPSLDWLDALEKNRWNERNNHQRGIPRINPGKINNSIYSHIRRPPSQANITLLSIVDAGCKRSQLDGVMVCLGRWLTRHMDSQKLILWVAKQGGKLHPDFSEIIKEQIVSSEKHATLSPAVLKLWNLLLSGRIVTYDKSFEYFIYLKEFKRVQDITPTVRLKLREIFTPHVSLRKKFDIEGNKSTPKKVRDIVHCEIRLPINTRLFDSVLEHLDDNLAWQKAQPRLLYDFTQLLHDAFDLMKELDHVTNHVDLSHIYLPSISECPETFYHSDLSILIHLVRDAWLETSKTNKERARTIAKEWWGIQYPIFKRLCFFAATYTNIISKKQAVSWLLAEKRRWLWSIDTQVEVLRLLAIIPPTLGEKDLRKLEQSIIVGPTHELQVNPEVDDYKIWVRLKVLESGGIDLTQSAKAKLEELTSKYPKFHPDEQDEGNSPLCIEARFGHEVTTQIYKDVTPRSKTQLIEWIKNNFVTQGMAADDEWWKIVCTEDFDLAVDALSDQSILDLFPSKPWEIILYIATNEDFLSKSWRKLPHVLVNADIDQIQCISHPLAWWLKTQSKQFEDHEDFFFKLINMILDVEEHQDGVRFEDLVTTAINHPIGLVTTALIEWLYSQKPEAMEGLRPIIKEYLSKICDTKNERLVNGRIVLAAHVVPLFKIDEDWTRSNLLPLFYWDQMPDEALGAWKGFLWSPRAYRPFIREVTDQLLNTFSHYDDLGDHKNQFISFITFTKLNNDDFLEDAKLKDAILKLPIDGIANIARDLGRAFNSVDEQRCEYWNNRIKPFIRNIFPNTIKYKTEEVLQYMTKLCIDAGDCFEMVVDDLNSQGWLDKLQYADGHLRSLLYGGSCKTYPDHSLTFLLKIIGEGSEVNIINLEQCLVDIKSHDNFENDGRYIELRTYCD